MSKITESARGEECQIRIVGVCNRDNTTVVFCHANGGGMGMKMPDSEGAYGCSACHDVVDGRVRTAVVRPWWEIELDFLAGQRRTRKILMEKDLLILK